LSVTRTRGEGEKIAGGKDFPGFREPAGVFMHLISMNEWHPRLPDTPRHLLVARWVEARFTLPVRHGNKRTPPGKNKAPSFRRSTRRVPA